MCCWLGLSLRQLMYYSCAGSVLPGKVMILCCLLYMHRGPQVCPITSCLGIVCKGILYHPVVLRWQRILIVVWSNWARTFAQCHFVYHKVRPWIPCNDFDYLVVQEVACQGWINIRLSKFAILECCHYMSVVA